MELWTAFILGLAGSLHCAGMCGPLALGMPAAASPAQFVPSRLAYNFGRVLTYVMLGAAFGLMGRSLSFIGLQRWLSLVAGIGMLLFFLLSTRLSLAARAGRPLIWIKTALAKVLRQPTLGGAFTLGLLNGLLPCGLVYAAGATAAATGHALNGMAAMAAFGLGTVPMMLGLGLFGQKLQWALRFRLQRLIPTTLVVVSVLLIFRGLALGIPYLSPDLAHRSCCEHAVAAEK